MAENPSPEEGQGFYGPVACGRAALSHIVHTSATRRLRVKPYRETNRDPRGPRAAAPAAREPRRVAHGQGTGSDMATSA
eukprot:5737649-Prymnesium_polylepis.1